MMIRTFVALLGLMAIGFSIGGSILFRSSQVAAAILGHRDVALSVDSLTEAVRAGDIERVRLLVRAGVAADRPDSAGQVPLLAAIRSGRRDMAQVAVAHAEKLEAADGRGLTAMSHALLMEDWELARRLAARGAKVDVDLAVGRPAIVEATAARHRRLFDFLLEHGADVNVRSVDGLTPLMLALGHRDHEVLEKLLGAGADPDTADSWGNPALLAAVRLRDVAAVELLAEHGADPDLEPAGGVSPLAAAVSGNDLETVLTLLSRGMIPRADEAQEVPLLLAAVRHGNLAMVRSLAEAGASLTAKGPLGETALGEAAERGEHEIFFALRDMGAPFMPAIGKILEAGDEEFVGLLLGRGIELETAIDESGETPLARLVRLGNLAVAKRFLDAGARADVTCRDGQPALAWSVAHRDPALLNALLQAGADPNVRLSSPVSKEFGSRFEEGKLSYYLRHDSGLTPLMVAAGSRQKEMVRDLLRHGANSGLHTRRHKTYPIQFAAQINDTDLMQMILGKEAGDRTRRVVIDLSRQHAWLYLDGKAQLSTTVSTGKRGYETPTGEYVVTNKHRHWTSTIYGAPMPYFMRLNTGAIGMHQGNVPSYPASHGCIRMPNSAARRFFQIVQVGDVVSISR